MAAVVLTVAYFTYGRFLSRFCSSMRIGPRRPSSCATTSTTCRSSRSFCLSQHFSAIAAAGPIVGPILAGVMFGWLPALMWILVGSIFIGGVHDMTALTASIRHKARSIAEVVRDHMSQRRTSCF